MTENRGYAVVDRTENYVVDSGSFYDMSIKARRLNATYKPGHKNYVICELKEIVNTVVGADNTENAGLGVGHIWNNTRCPAYNTLTGSDCKCNNKKEHECNGWGLHPYDCGG